MSAEQLVLEGVAPARGGTLPERAVAFLGDGPQGTAAVAEAVLGLRGNPAAAAAAVFTLLGTDSRFRVDAAGVWSLAAPAHPSSASSLLEEEWAVVDVETTGGSPERGHRITEVAAVFVSGGRVRDSYSTLVNPERPIPAMITSLTGISEAMVRGAPRFREIAPDLRTALAGRVFVAHNAAFDWRFLCSELDRATGRRLEGRQLCTVRLARKLLPQLPSRGLDALAIYFGLRIEARHRALDDALATAHVLLRFISILQDRGVSDWEGMEIVLGRRQPRRKRSAFPRSMESA